LPFRRVCVFSGSLPGVRPLYSRAADKLGRALAHRGLGLVYGGASVGLMGALADAALAERGEVIGIIPEALVRKEIAHPGLSELRVVSSMHERKATMAELAGAFIALPGGLGTLEELFEVLTWAQLGLHTKPIGLLDVAGFYQPVLSTLQHMVSEGFIPAAHMQLLVARSEPEPLLDALATHTPPVLGRKWLMPAQT
jgi:uncharacterized protein (TIGR00730 family)